MDPLSSGKLLRVLKGEQLKGVEFQILSFHCISKDAVFRVALSDGLFSTTFAAFSSRLADRANVHETNVVKLLSYTLKKITCGNNKRNLIFINDMKVLARPNEVIGDPKSLDDLGAPAKKSKNCSWVKSQFNEEPKPVLKNPFEMRLVRAVDLGTEIKKWEGWVIRVRVMRKLPACLTYNGMDKMMTCDLADSSGFIRAVSFGSLCSKLDALQVNRVYWLTSAQIRINKDINSKSSFELMFNNTTMVQECQDNSGLPSLEFSFSPLQCIKNCTNDKTVDVIGVCETVSKMQFVAGRFQQEIKLVSPQSGPVQVSMMLWDEIAPELDDGSHPVLAVKSCKVLIQQDGDPMLWLDHCSALILNPQLPQTKEYKTWFHEQHGGMKEELRAAPEPPDEEPEFIETSDFTEAKRQVLLSSKLILLVKCEVEVVDSDQKFLIKLRCVQCMKKVRVFGKLLCQSCGFVERASISSCFLRIRLGNETLSDWVTIRNSKCCKLLGLTSDYIEGCTTKFWEAIKALTGCKFSVHLKYNKQRGCKIPCEAISIEPSTSSQLGNPSHDVHSTDTCMGMDVNRPFGSINVEG